MSSHYRHHRYEMISDDYYYVVALFLRPETDLSFVVSFVAGVVERRRRLEWSLGESCCLDLIKVVTDESGAGRWL